MAALGTTGNQYTRRINRQPAASHPFSPGRAVPSHSGRRLVVVDQAVQVSATGNGLECSPQRRLRRIADQTAFAQIEQGGIVSLVVGSLL
jgi:hypothetical protein